MGDDEAYELCREHIRSRADALPPAVWECDICGGRMRLRSSHLNRDVMADDIKALNVVRREGGTWQTTPRSRSTLTTDITALSVTDTREKWITSAPIG